MAWVNAQLKKRPAVKPVQDLRQDLRDGVILAYLIEIVGQLALDTDASLNQNMAFFILHMSFTADCCFFKIYGNGSRADLKYLPKVNSFIY